MKILNKITFLWKVHYLLIKQCLSRLWHFEENKRNWITTEI